MRVVFAIAGLLAFAASGRGAVTIVSVAGANPASEQDVRLDANSLVAVHWKSGAAYTNVSVAAKLYCTPCTDKNDAGYADAYLMTDIGPLVTAAQQVAYARVRVTGTKSLVTLFSGLTLAAGDYYLVIYSPTRITGGTSEAAVAWGGTSDANALVTTVAGTSREGMLIYSNNVDAPLINASFPPSSFFFRSPTTPSFDLTGSYNLQYQVASTPSLFVPQVVAGGGWKTTIALVNLEPVAVNFRIQFQNGEGRDLGLSMTPGGTSPSGVLPPGGTYFGETVAGTAGSLVQGSAEIATSGRLGVSVALRQTGSGGGYQEVTMRGTEPATTYTFFFDNVQGMTTIALANGNASSPLRVTLIGQAEGGTVAEATVQLPARGHRALALTSVMPGLAGMRGMLRMFVATPDLVAMGLRFDPNGMFTLVPGLE